MRALALILLAGVFVAHGTANWLADGSRFTPAAWFYMLHGLWEAVLAGGLLVILHAMVRDVWQRLAVAALWITVSEGLQVSVCRAVIDDISKVPKGVNLCDYASGLQIGAAAMMIYIGVLAFVVGRRLWNEIER